MKQFLKYFLLLNTLLFSTHLSYAAQEVEMADTLRSNGMIYVVVAILGIILVGLLTYLISIDKKISKIEKELDL